MSCINTRIEVDDGRAVTVPFTETKVKVVRHTTIGLHNHTVPCVNSVNHVNGVVHHGPDLALRKPAPL